MTETVENRVVVTWAGPGEPVVLAVYSPDGEAVALPLEPKRALTLAQELLTQGVQAIRRTRRLRGHPSERGPYCARGPPRAARAVLVAREASGGEIAL